MSDQDVELIQTFQDVSAWAKGMCSRIRFLRGKITRYEDITALDKVWNYAERFASGAGGPSEAPRVMTICTTTKNVP